MKSLVGLLMLTAGLAILGACEDDPVEPTPPASQKFENLSQKWHVLNNFELAYNERRIDPYDRLLDADFMFYLDRHDTLGAMPEQWNRATEVTVNTRLFDKNYSGPFRCKYVSLVLPFANVPWTEIPSPGSTETWYTTTVFYDFQIDVEPKVTYINNPGARAEFTVRNAGTEDAPKWRLVEMRDFGSGEEDVRTPQTAASTETASLGKIKAAYYLNSPP